jgi:putative peptidoglycan lipid II flippase
VLVGLLMLAARCGSMIKELVIARSFGLGDALDAFLIALVLPIALTGLVAGSFGGALVPVYIRVREEQGAAAAQRVFSGVQIVNLLLLGAAAILLATGASYYLPLLGSGFGPAKLQLTRSLLYLLAPFVVLSGLAPIWSCVLNAHRRFAVPAITPVVTPLVCLLALLFWRRHWGIYALAGGTVAGALLEAAILGLMLRSSGISLGIRWYGFSPELRTVLAQYVPAFLATAVGSASLLIDQSMAAMLGPGSVSALSYGSKIAFALSALASVAIGTAILPYFSELAAARDWASYSRILKTYSRLILAVTVPVTVALVVGSQPLVRILFQRGAFTRSDTITVSAVQMFLAPMIPFAACGSLYVRTLYSLQRNDLLAYASLLSALLNVILNLLFMKIWGVVGIALSTSAVCAIVCAFMYFHSIRLLAKKRQA